jgi:hypothetical protein
MNLTDLTLLWLLLARNGAGVRGGLWPAHFFAAAAMAARREGRRRALYGIFSAYSKRQARYARVYGMFYSTRY